MRTNLFMRGGCFCYRFRGTIYHRIMELLYGTGDDSIDDITADLSGWIKHMEEKGKVPAGAFESVKTEDFLKFYKSEIGGRMKQAMLKGKLLIFPTFLIKLLNFATRFGSEKMLSKIAYNSQMRKNG